MKPMTNTLEETIVCSKSDGLSSYTLDELVMAAHPVLNTSVFTYASVLRANGKLSFMVYKPAGTDLRSGHLLFHENGDLLTCCNRLSAFTSNGLQEICSIILKHRPNALLVFPDIVMEDDGALELPNQCISYQENWFRTADPGEPYLAKRKRKSLMRRLRRWKESVGDKEIEFRFRKASAEDIDQIIAMNAESLEARGRRHHFPQQSRANLVSICGNIGFFGGLYLGDELVAGDILSIIGDQAWFHIGGYDHRYREFSPGNQLHAMIAEACMNRNITKFNFLWGNSRWKSDAGGTRIPLKTVFVSRTAGAWLSWNSSIPTGPMLNRPCAIGLLKSRGM